MYNNSKYIQTGSLLDRLPRNDDGSLARQESLFKGLSATEDREMSAQYNAANYRDHSRPTSITVVGVLLVITLVYGLIQLLTILPYAKYLPAWVWPIVLVNYGLLIASISGLFTMKKYGAWSFVAQAVISTLYSFAVSAVSLGLLNAAGSAIILVFIFRKYQDMQ